MTISRQGNAWLGSPEVKERQRHHSSRLLKKLVNPHKPWPFWRCFCRPSGARIVCFLVVNLGLTGLLKNSFYVSLSGYGLVSCGLCTQGGALPLDELGAKLTLGYSMEPLRGKGSGQGFGARLRRAKAEFFNRP